MYLGSQFQTFLFTMMRGHGGSDQCKRGAENVMPALRSSLFHQGFSLFGVLPTFRTGLPSLANVSWKRFHQYLERRTVLTS